ncbi:MAG: extracellular solute-binding protein, partial [Pseudomonadota bacterium]
MRQWRWVIVFLAVVAVMASPLSARSDHHAVSVWGEPALPPDFTHFPYANPDAVKGGVIRLFGYGTFDTLNPYSLTGIAPLGAEFLYDTLLEPSADELATAYGLLAERVVTNGNQVTFFLRDQARFHDGTRVRAQDVVQSFITLREHGHPRFRNRYRSVTKAEAIAPNQVRFTLAGDDMRELPFLLGQIPVMAQRDLIGRDFDQVDLQPILGSGPYRVGTMKAGRVIEYVRLENYWARDLPVRLGLYNFDRVIYDYYRDFTVAREAFKTGELDLWVEYTARFWASAFDLPEIADGQMLKHAFPHGRVARYQAMFFNLRNPLFQDPRVREAISLAWDFEWINKTVMFSAYTRLRSIFDNSKLAAADLPD